MFRFIVMSLGVVSLAGGVAWAQLDRPNFGQNTVRADGLAKALDTFRANHRNLGCYDARVYSEGTSGEVMFFPRRPMAAAGSGNVIISTGPVAGCGGAVGYRIDEAGEIWPVNMGRD